VLADWGADVIKVEAPAGDPMRRFLQLMGGHGRTESPPFDLDNRGKRSVVLDLREPEERAAMRRLIATADVFLTNLRPDAVERLGAAPEDVLPDNPRLVYASVSGYGRRGPDAARAAYDVGAFWARTGIAATLSPEGAPPVDIRSGFGDHITAMTTVAGICAALLERERTGVGQLVETSLLRTGIWCLGWDLAIEMRFGKRAPTTPRDQAFNPMTNAYRARDDRWFWLLGVEGDRLWPDLLVAIDVPAIAADERFGDARGRRKNARDLVAALDAVFLARDRDEWAQRFDAAGVWWAPVNTTTEVLVDEQAIAAGAYVDVPEGAGAASHRAVATPVVFGTSAVGPTGPVPALGEHTDEVLRELV
jgi:crotonobetainyl-CoA:carnitine CoA-transferase CaiB-like acyl-CoA transferase